MGDGARLGRSHAGALPGLIPADHPVARSSLVRGLIARCRFAAAPIDDIERLAAWCREHTPDSARFIGPPGPKTFRLWSRRSLAFNRAGSPYHAAGLADWFARFQDHVDVHDSPEVFVQKYLSGRHELEARYDELSDEKCAELAVRQGADHVIAPRRRARFPPRFDIRSGQPSVALAPGGSFRGLPDQARNAVSASASGSGPVPAVTQPVGEHGRVDGGQDLDPRCIPPGLGQRRRAQRIAPQLQPLGPGSASGAVPLQVMACWPASASSLEPRRTR